MLKGKLTLMALVIAVLVTGHVEAKTQSDQQNVQQPKFIFYFIGDGMASPQIHATEAYLASLEGDDADPGSIKAAKLTMTGFPVQGMQMSFANNRFITDSAAAGTALACGMKTNVGVVSMDPNGKSSYVTLAETAKKKGMKVGIISSVSIDHATPAVFYSHSESRNNYEQIGEQLMESGFDYFGGGGFRVNKYEGKDYADKENEERYSILKSKAKKHGFTYVDTRKDFDALKEGNHPVIAVNPYLDSSNAMPYALNRMAADGAGEDYEGSISLSEFTQKGIDLLDNDKGFFMMVEGGKIDWACHANDARAAIEDTIAFDKAVAVAAQFAEKHPEETLIVVTGDHECGGMTLGFAGTEYDTYYEKMGGQSVAYDDFDAKIFEAYKSSHNPAPENIDKDMWKIISNNFGMDGAGLTPDKDDDLDEYERNLLENAFDKAVKGEGVSPEDQENMILYGFYNPLSVTLTHVLNRKCGLAWTSYSHTAVPVPVLATGAGSGRFNGYYDNTEVAKKIADLMQVTLASSK
jgi:alkaline phosphatase